MHIVVEDLPQEETLLAGDVGLDLRAYDEAEDIAVSGPATYRFRVSRLGSTVTIDGHLAVGVEAPCSRCAQPVAIPIDRDFEAIFVTADTGEADRAVELDETDLALDYYEGGVIDGLRLLAEQVFLELPMKILCAEDCKGLCPQCGANLNLTDCECEPEGDPRWAALEQLKDRL